MSKAIITLVSLSVHESFETVLDQIDSINHFLEQPIVVLHVNSESEKLYELLVEYEKKFFEKNQQVIINPNRVNCSKSAYLLDVAHCNNLDFVGSKHIAYDYVVLESSNSLFVRYGYDNYIQEFDIGINLSKNTGDYWYPKVSNHKTIMELYKEYFPIALSENYVFKSVHEGSFFKKALATEVFNTVKQFRALCEQHQDYPNYPTEEFWTVLAVVILKNKLPQLSVSKTTTYMPWDKDLSWHKNDIRDFLFKATNLNNYYSVKRIERQYNDETRKFIRDIFGY